MSNYTQKEVDKLVEIYTENPCIETVNKLTIELNKTKKSIIAKLVKEGVYVTKGYRTKTGDIPITKLEMVRSLEDVLDVTLPGLDKAPKTTLKLLSDTVVDMSDLLESSLEEIASLKDVERVRSEMKNLRNFDDPLAILAEGTSKRK